MAGINTGKLITGGLAAGVVLNVIDFVANTYILADTYKAELDAINPSLYATMSQGSTIAGFVVIDFILGILAVWVYAAIRPRFGPGPGTAIKAGLLVWAVAGAAWTSFYLMGLFGTTGFLMSAVIGLVNVLAATWVGARLYSEAA